jgi:hypothetical protein
MRRSRMDEATAKKVAQDVGVELPPKEVAPRKRAARKRTPNRNGPVEKTILWSAVDPTTKLHALFRADQDIRRCKPVSKFVVVVLNHPQRKAPR